MKNAKIEMFPVNFKHCVGRWQKQKKKEPKQQMLHTEVIGYLLRKEMRGREV